MIGVREFGRFHGFAALLLTEVRSQVERISGEYLYCEVRFTRHSIHLGRAKLKRPYPEIKHRSTANKQPYCCANGS